MPINSDLNIPVVLPTPCPSCAAVGNVGRCECRVCPTCSCRRLPEDLCSNCNLCTYNGDCDCSSCASCQRMTTSRQCQSCNNCENCCQCWECNNCDNSYASSSQKCNNCNYCSNCCECESGISFFRQDQPTFHAAPKGKFKVNPSTRYIAAEIEVASVAARTVSDPEAMTVSRAVKKWKGQIVEDGSLPHGGFEINTAPASGDLFVEEIGEICEMLKESHAKVTKECGLHIHVNAQDHNFYDIRKLMMLYQKIEPALFSIIAPSRKVSRYCHPCGDNYIKNLEKGIIPKDNEKIIKKNVYGNEDESIVYLKQNKYHDARYNAMNLHSWVYRGSVEFRMHHGTVSASKIQNWGMLCAGILDYAFDRNEAEIKAMKGDSFGLLLEVAPTDRVKNWIIDRRKHFERNNDE